MGHLGNIVRHLGHLGTILGPFWAILNHLGVFFYYLTFYDYLLYIYIYIYVCERSHLAQVAQVIHLKTSMLWELQRQLAVREQQLASQRDLHLEPIN